ncbi:hypothetical protein QTG54_015700 [Skeletonema marinoi]|uniref:RING-type domain-containing protein n=1 Tax=Skeletonema marinoi TaxID=267567 RepID=A0AAD8XUC3_9STRA|nr:hypothetical protein QTG54_015700 [Skeletonema marinoi]
MIPLQLDLSKSSMQTCCSKVVCKGCFHANLFREEKERLENKCPFCRKLIPDTDEECDKRRMERIEMDDPVAIAHEGVQLYIKGDREGAFVHYLKAAELGDMEAHYKLSLMYHFGVFGGSDDRKNEMWHLEEASIGGHPGARYKLGWLEWSNKRTERAVKHWVVAASQGHDDSLEFLMKKFKGGFVKKEVLAAALRAHQAAVNATKSPQREATEAALGK